MDASQASRVAWTLHELGQAVRDGVPCPVMPVRLFTFVQMELPWELGPADGRYLLRKPAGPEGNEPEHVVVLSTVGAERRGLLGGRSRTRRTGRARFESPRVPVARATIVDPVALSLDAQARKWLEQLDPEREARAAAGVLNRVLWAHRIADAEAHVHEVSPTQALIVRAGYGEGEQVADGLWTDARELVLSRKRSGRRATVLRPQERLAMLLSSRGSALLCEELVLRARLDLDGGRLAMASIELERAYAAALGELPAERREDMRERIDELAELKEEVVRAARVALPVAPPPADATHTGPRARPGTGAGERTGAGAGLYVSETRDSRAREAPDEQVVRHALERLEAALRARTAAGFTVR
jgi:hypothetical protein